MARKGKGKRKEQRAIASPPKRFAPRRRAYEAASPHDGWRPRRAGASANTDHRADAHLLRAKARSLVQNVPYVSRAIDVLVSAHIGTGIEIESTARLRRTQRLYTERFAQWSMACDADGIHALDGLMAVAFRAMLVDGEVLIRRRTRRAPGAPVQLQVLEIDWLDGSKHGVMAGGERVLNGIQYRDDGSIRGYYLFDAHPGDTGFFGNPGVSRLVDADDIIHLFEAKRPGQSRGISALAAVIARTRDMQTYEDAELARKNIEPRLGVLASGSPDLDPKNYPGSFEADPGPNASAPDGWNFNAAYPDEEAAEELSAGGITYLPHGMQVTAFEPASPPGFTDYMTYNLHIVASCLGVPFESMTGDMSGVNFSSARIRQLEFRRDVEQRQWVTLYPRLIAPIWRWFTEALELDTGVAPDPGIEVSFPRWDYVNPKQDIDAEIQAIKHGLLSPSESLRRRGYKPDRVFEEIAADYKKLADSGAIDFLRFMASPEAPPDAGSE